MMFTCKLLLQGVCCVVLMCQYYCVVCKYQRCGLDSDRNSLYINCLVRFKIPKIVCLHL